ncbi:hypothetical protein E2C01_037153 [Portunus trituberculatus]|uniref:Uncharacterized protein n=1 Tax=Portunus trituberculatus TaxID=210409 RepID=A0A5B7FDD5_PORTR|nr:hypothetical protein [Portunus trituberculatus]
MSIKWPNRTQISRQKCVPVLHHILSIIPSLTKILSVIATWCTQRDRNTLVTY